MLHWDGNAWAVQNSGLNVNRGPHGRACHRRAPASAGGLARGLSVKRHTGACGIAGGTRRGPSAPGQSARFRLMSMGFSKGFTLVELIAVLVIVALIAAAGRSLFFDIDVFRQRGFFEETLSAVRYAQKHAVASGCPVRVQTTATGFTLFRSANVAACAGGPYNTPIADPSGGAATFTRSRAGRRSRRAQTSFSPPTAPSTSARRRSTSASAAVDSACTATPGLWSDDESSKVLRRACAAPPWWS